MFDDDDDDEEPGSYQSVSVSLFDARLQIVCISFALYHHQPPSYLRGYGCSFFGTDKRKFGHATGCTCLNLFERSRGITRSLRRPAYPVQRVPLFALKWSQNTLRSKKKVYQR